MEFAPWPRPFFERIRPTFLESWPLALKDLAVRHESLPLTLEETRTLARAVPLWRERLISSDPRGLHSIAAKLQPVLEGSPQGIFVRLGSGSPKDCPLFRANGGRARTVVTALKLLQTSPRVRAHLKRCLSLDYSPRLFVRRWEQVEPWQELRCFMRHHRLVGISQVTHHDGEFLRPLASAAPAVTQALHRFFAEVARASHLHSAVFDVWCVAEQGTFRPRLLDANPWGPPSDPCLFNWGQPREFDGSLRYLGLPGVRIVPAPYK